MAGGSRPQVAVVLHFNAEVACSGSNPNRELVEKLVADGWTAIGVE